MRLWKVWIESVRHLADFGREPGCHFTPGCIGNRTHRPFLFKERWWVLFCQSLNPSFRSRSRLKFVDDGLSEDMMGSQFLREFRERIVGKLGGVGMNLWGFDVRRGVSFWNLGMNVLWWSFGVIVPGVSWVRGMEAAKCQVLRDFGCHHSDSIP